MRVPRDPLFYFRGNSPPDAPITAGGVPQTQDNTRAADNLHDSAHGFGRHGILETPWSF
jgi:hypothetical protein